MVERRVSGFQEGQNDSRSWVCRLILLTVSLMLMPPLHPLCAELEVPSSREVRQDVLLNPEEAAEGDDPFEDFNRVTFSFNEGVDTLVLLPLTALYRFFVPSLVKEGVQNVLENLSSPVSVVNYTLQGNGAHAGQMLGQFLVNSLLGLGGVFSVARHFGFDVPPTGFGQTLGVWGGGSGPYLIWPFWGPSTPRDSTGLLVDFLLDPINILAFAKDRWWASRVRGYTYLLDKKIYYSDMLSEVENTAVDYYSAVKSLYFQERGDRVREGETENELEPVF